MVDLTKSEMPKRPDVNVTPSVEKARLIAKVRAYALKHPSEAKQLQRECHRVIEEVRPPSEERTLNLRQAAKRIGIAHTQVFKLAKSGRLGEYIDGKPRFSEHECDHYRMSERKPGPRPGTIRPPTS